MMSPKIYIFISLLLCLTLQAASDRCPDPDKLPTTCECLDHFEDEDIDGELSCSGSTMTELEYALSLVDKNIRLEILLDSMDLGDLPARLFYGLNVVHLDISHCQLDALAPPGETALQGLEETLEVLEIFSSFTEENKPTELPSLAHLNRLREFDLSHNAITEVPDHWFSSPPPALTQLSLTNNGIEKLGDRAFEKLVFIETLELHGNRFGPIKRSMLPEQGNHLDHLELDNNAFTSLPDNLFHGMPELRTLSIRTNGISHLQEKIFKPIWSQLDVFDARGNPLQCDSSMEWLFHEINGAGLVLGTCEGPSGTEGMDLKDFIESRGH